MAAAKSAGRSQPFIATDQLLHSSVYRRLLAMSDFAVGAMRQVHLNYARGVDAAMKGVAEANRQSIHFDQTHTPLERLSAMVGHHHHTTAGAPVTHSADEKSILARDLPPAPVPGGAYTGGVPAPLIVPDPQSSTAASIAAASGGGNNIQPPLMTRPTSMSVADPLDVTTHTRPGMASTEMVALHFPSAPHTSGGAPSPTVHVPPPIGALSPPTSSVAPPPSLSPLPVALPILAPPTAGSAPAPVSNPAPAPHHS